MKTSKITQGVKYAGFGVVVMTALAISWWSMATMAMDSFGLPAYLAYAVSTAYDGAAIFVAVIATEYTKSEDSGLGARLMTLLFIALSSWLNLQHAQMMDLNLAGQVFYAAPSIIAGLLLEVMLRFENRRELRKRGRVSQALPVFGKIAWLRYPRVTFDRVSDIVKTRIINTDDKATSVQDNVQTEIPASKTSDMSIAKLVQSMYTNGERDKAVIRDNVSKIKGTEVSMGTVQKSISRIKT